MILREAALDDTRGVVAVHLTNPDRPFDRPVESLSISERGDHGGPWMSVESCAIHLNNLLAWGQGPLVVEDGGRVIAETEFTVSRDVPPFGTTLDVSVLYVHSNFQRQGAGTLLMEEMIRRGKRANCDHITVSGGVDSPEFYRRFGFSPALDPSTIECEVPSTTLPATCEPYVPGDFCPPPPESLWIGRSQGPSQKWRQIVDRIKRRDPILPEHAAWPRPVGMISKSGGFLLFLVPGWRDPARASIYCWSETLTGGMVAESLAQARLAGYSRVSLLCHPDVVDLVAEVCGCGPSGSWPIWGKIL